MTFNRPVSTICKNEYPFDIRPYMRAAITNDTDLPPLPPELVQGIARKGDKVIFTGASKSGKTCALLSLATCFATGMEWCGMQCAKARVMFVNLEVREELFWHRQCEVCKALGADSNAIKENLTLYNLRGKFSEIGELVDSLLAEAEKSKYDVIIIDPAYKVQNGIENNADAIKKFCGELDRLAESLGCSIIYSHHHSKGYQAWKDAEDRASGSGVFARDADAIIDLVELEPSDSSDEGTPFRMEFVLRGFAEHDPIGVWFKYPCHHIDRTGNLIKQSPRKPGSTKHTDESESRNALADFEEKLDAYLGERTMVHRIDFERDSGISHKALKRLLERSKKFKTVTLANQVEIHRCQTLANSGQPTPSMQGAQAAGFL